MVFRPRTKQSDKRFAPTVLLIFQKQFDIHYIRRNPPCPMDSHTDSPAESPKPYRNRNRYLYILYLLCSLSYGCPMDTFLLSFWSSPNHSVKIKIFLLTWCKVVLSYARKKAKEVCSMIYNLISETTGEIYRLYNNRTIRYRP